MISTRKLKLTILGTDEERKIGYRFIRDSQYSQYRGLNLAMSILSSAYLQSDRNASSDTFKNAQKSLTNSNEIFNGINFGKGLDSKSAITQKVKKDFSTALKNGLARGERSFTNYKRTFPLITRGRSLKFQYQDDDIIIKWVNKITFKVVLGSGKIKENKIELQHILHKIINGEYKVGQSSLYFDKKNNLMINLTIDIPIENNNEPVKDRVLGVDLGIKYPVYMCLKDDMYKRKSLGSINDFLRVRKQMQERRKKLQRDLSNTRGGKGRNKKLQALNRFKEKEANFVQTYNHILSKNVVKFAKENKCEYIHLEKLTKKGFPDSILRNWSYYQLQQYIQYKAEREGIKVRYVNPAFTSQKCSRCKNVDKENRPSQEVFICTNCGFGKTSGMMHEDENGKKIYYMNADHNAAINIANSTDFIKNDKDIEKLEEKEFQKEIEQQ